jgi:hypothetical protein
MKHEQIEGDTIDYHPCRYGNSKIFFRGPRKSLKGRYVTFIGSTETYGKGVESPFPTRVEQSTGITCVNFGCVNASVDAFLPESTVHEVCQSAALNILQIMGAHNMSNRFYTVHPRRNDRFVRASSVMTAIYPEVDFTEFCFTRHMLASLYELSPERFEIIQSELQMAWRARMRSSIREIGSHTLLLWFSETLPSDAHLGDRPDPINSDPLFVTRSMIDELRPFVQGVILVQPPARKGNDEGATLMTSKAHEAAAEAISDALAKRLQT